MKWIGRVLAAAVAMTTASCAPAAGTVVPESLGSPESSAAAVASVAPSASAEASTASASAAPSVPRASAPPEVKGAYVREILSVLKNLWSPHCTDEAAKASGTITIDRFVITDVSDPSLEFLLGAVLPSPPKEYPDMVVTSAPVDFTCPKKRPAP